MSTMSPQTSALERMLTLPPLFRGADLTVRFAWSSKTASQYLWLWKKRSLIQGLGGHSDVYANLLREPSPDWGRAVLMAMPTAITVGIEALRQSGWTTQIPSSPDVAVLAGRPAFKLERFSVQKRTARWAEATAAGRHQAAPGALPVLRPAWALADLLRSGPWGTFGLDPDDIEWDEVTPKDEADWQEACTAMGLALPDLAEMAELADGPGHQPDVCSAR
jgi:hypothetical protein